MLEVVRLRVVVEVHADAAAAAVEAQEKINRACNDASLIRNLAGVMWVCFFVGYLPFVGCFADLAALVLFFLVLPVFTFVLHPLGSWMSRRHEFEADAFAASQTHAGDLVSALVKLYEDNASTLTPDPVHSAFYDSHPPALVRIAKLRSLANA